MRLSKLQLWGLFKFMFLVVILYFVLKTILLPLIISPAFQEFTQKIGVFGYLVVICYVALSHVFAPLAGTPGVVLGVTIYGLNVGMWLLYIGSLISALISFYISKRLGRRWVIKLVGKDAMKKIDDFAVVEGKKALMVSRLFGFALFDLISYAAGLTSLSYKNYMIITAVCGLVPNLVMQFLFQSLDFQSEMGIMIWVGSIVIAAIIFGLLVRLYLKRKNNHVVYAKR